MRMRRLRLNNYLVANVVLWTLTYLIVTARVMADPMPHAGAMAVRRLFMSGLGVLACIAIGKILSSIADQPIWRRLAVALLLSILGGFSYSYMNYAVFYLVAPQ